MDAHEPPSQSNPVSEPAPELSGDVPIETGRGEAENEPRSLVVFLDHTGTRFLFPFGECQTWSDFKSLVSQVYAKSTELARNEIEKEEFDILTMDFELVLPVVWDSVIQTLPLHKRGDHSYTVQLVFWALSIPANPRRRTGPSYVSSRPRAEISSPNESGPGTDRRDASIRLIGSDLSRPYHDDQGFIRTRRRRSRSATSEESIPRVVRSQEREKGSQSRSRGSRSRSRDTRSRPRGARSRSGSTRGRSPILEKTSSEDWDYTSPDVDTDEGGDDTDEDFTTVTGDEEEDPEPIQIQPPPRTVNTPLDRDNNPLSFLVDTKWPLRPNTNEITADKGGDLTKPQNIRDMKTESLKILKAVSITSDSRTTIQIHTFPGPESPSTAENVDVRWYHLHGDQLDFSQFKSTCLNIPGLPERLRKLTMKTLERIETEKLKAFLGGMFIEPGTVLRGDEKHQTDSHSVIFSSVPYFDIHPPFKPATGKSDRLHPPRSLMQSYYPYEPVRERDMEQAFQKYGSNPSNNIIQVPSLWMMNIGSRAVVTCGYRPLSSDFVKSITVVQEDMKSLVIKEGENSTLLNLRLTDWEGRVILYSPDECRSYFEMEQKLRVLKFFSNCVVTASLQMAWNTPEGKKKVTPGNWLNILKCQNRIFINLSIVDEKEARELDEKMNKENAEQIPASTSSNSIPPFFLWPLPSKSAAKLEDATMSGFEKPSTGLRFAKDVPEQVGSIPPEARRSMHCLEQVEKAMETEIISEYDAQNVVDKTFTSTTHYQSLPEATFEDVRNSFISLLYSTDGGGRSSDSSMHQIVTDMQCSQLTTKTSDLIETINKTLRLFVPDVDTNTMLRKVWGAMKSMGATVGQVQKRCATKPDPSEYTDSEWKAPMTGNRKWTIRTPTKSVKKGYVPMPDADSDLIQSVKKCRQCRHSKVYDDPNDALKHLSIHLQYDPTKTMSSAKTPNLQRWVRNDEEMVVEELNAGYLTIVTQVSDAAQALLVEIRQLAEGVQNEEGKMSELYTLPQELLKTLRRLVVFYLAIERAFYHTELSLKKRDEKIEEEDVPFSNMGLEVLSRFCEGAKTSVLIARKELCIMARTSLPDDVSKRINLGPEYLCSWFIRRLLVKPLNNSMTAADIYREYLSTLQFQVNHRPGKRLLRSINLLQEELAALQQVNSWQNKLIDSYSRVLDDTTYEKDIPSRRAFYQYERLLLDSCLDNLMDTRDDFAELIRRCGPLSDSTKQSAEINEEDHGKAIFVFTVVTVIFMPLSFVTSYLGMNTSDIRDMESKQALFWEIALPLTAMTMGTILFMAYNGDEIRDAISSLSKRLMGKQDTSIAARGISVAQRRRASKLPSDSSSTVDYKSLADEAEFAPPRGPVGFGFQRFDFRDRTTYLDKYDKKGPVAINYADHYTPMMQIKLGGPPDKTTYGYGRGSRLPPPPPVPRTAATYADGGASRPTYMRVARKYVETETLLHYGIPWEIDSTDPDYFLLLRYMDEAETDMLFEHTKRLRQRAPTLRSFRYVGEPDRGGDVYVDRKENAPKEYEWVRKRPRRSSDERAFRYMENGRRTRRHRAYV